MASVTVYHNVKQLYTSIVSSRETPALNQACR